MGGKRAAGGRGGPDTCMPSIHIEDNLTLAPVSLMQLSEIVRTHRHRHGRYRNETHSRNTRINLFDFMEYFPKEEPSLTSTRGRTIWEGTWTKFTVVFVQCHFFCFCPLHHGLFKASVYRIQRQYCYYK